MVQNLAIALQKNGKWQMENGKWQMQMANAKWDKDVVDVEWHISRAHTFGARGPGFDPTPKLNKAFFQKTLISLLSDNGLKKK